MPQTGLERGEPPRFFLCFTGNYNYNIKNAAFKHFLRRPAEEKGEYTMEKVYQILKMFFVFAFSLGQLFAPKPTGGDFPPGAPAAPGDQTKYLQIDTVDEGFDTFRPVRVNDVFFILLIQRLRAFPIQDPGKRLRRS